MFAFFRPSSVSGTQCVISMGAASGSNAGIGLNITSATVFNVQISGIGSVPGTASETMLNKWCSIAMTKASGSSSYILYFNGAIANGSGSLTGNFTDAVLHIGSDQSNSNIFNGNISFAGIWAASLSSAEILELHKRFGQPSTSPRALYYMSEGVGSSLRDLSGNSNNGTISNITWSSGQVPYGSRSVASSRVSATSRALISGRVAA